jgi:hypothetical protein
MKLINQLLKGLFAVIILFFFIQCSKNSAESNEKTMIVGSQLVDCEGAGPMKCMQVKAKESDNWEYFYGNIQGFNYESGYEYVIKVKVEEVRNPPADGSSQQYTLITQVAKTKK